MLKLVLFVSLCAVALSRESFSWRGHELFCCRDGTYIQIKDDRVWSSSGPSVCPTVPSVDGFDCHAMLLILVSICCCVKQLQLRTAYIVYKLSNKNSV